MLDFWVWAILLLVTGLALATMEIFIPSGGILGFLAVAALVASVVVAFLHSALVGLVILATALFGLPVVAILGFKFWPRTAIGRRVLLTTPQSQDVLPDNPRLRVLKSLIGKVGRAKGPMLPSGPVVIEGRTIDAVSEGMAIEAGQLVRVVQVRGMEVIVQPADEGEALTSQPKQAAQDPLSQPIDALIPDPFQEPPTA